MTDKTEILMKQARERGHKITEALAEHINQLRKITLSSDEKEQTTALMSIMLFVLEVQGVMEKAKWVLENCKDSLDSKMKKDKADAND